MLLVRHCKNDASAVASHLQWPEAKVRAAITYAEAFPEEIGQALAEQDSADFTVLSQMLPQATEHKAGPDKKH